MAREAASEELKVIAILQYSPCHPWQGPPMRSQEILSPNNTAAATSAGRRRPPRVSLHSHSLIPLDHIARAGVSSPSARIRSFRRAQRQPLGTLGARLFRASNVAFARHPSAQKKKISVYFMLLLLLCILHKAFKAKISSCDTILFEEVKYFDS